MGYACSAVGCDYRVEARFTNILTGPNTPSPLTIEACIDDQCVTATVDLETNASDCDVSEQGTACCTFDPPAPGVQCLATVGGSVTITFPLGNSEPAGGHTIKGTVRDKNGAELLSDEKVVPPSQPNGPDCDPTCYGGSVSLGKP
ncbi:hypothetical protein A7982_13644 [Minicystis rosea]|nr:hypothetical protein A7982_13644 [Minicystis rosea]